MGTFDSSPFSHIILQQSGREEEHLFGIPLDRVKQSISETLRHAHLQAMEIPLVGIVPPQDFSPTFSIRLITEIETNKSLKNLSEVITSWFPLGTMFCPSAMHCIPFSVENNPHRRFFFWEMSAAVDQQDSHKLFTNQIAALQQEITLALRVPQCAPQLVSTRAASKEGNTQSLRQELIRQVLKGKKHSPPELLEELQRFLLATDPEFKSLRSPKLLLRLLRSHYWFRKRQKNSPSCAEGEKRLFFRVIPSSLHFPFGDRKVLSLVISLDSIQPQEQFDERHILLACQRSLETLDVVPRSFYSYTYADEPSVSLYVELEKKNGSPFFPSEILLLKKDLTHKLISSIEQLTSRIDIPQNEEDTIRSILLLSQQLRSIKDIPQVMIQFRGQSDKTLEFQVLLIRLLNESEEDRVQFSKFQDIVQLIPLRTAIVGKIRNKYPKQALTFLARCEKEPFLRHDRSIDFLKAREFVINRIEATLGKVRDLNGGLFLQQHQLLEGIRPLLNENELHELFIIEDLFHSIMPSIMKSMLGPEHILTLFRQLLTMRASLHEKKPTLFISEEYIQGIFIGFVCPEAFTVEEILQGRSRFHLSENDLALCSSVSQGKQYCFVICLEPSKEIRLALIQWIKKIIEEKKNQVIPPRSIRIGIPSPTLSLDPRIDADNTSGAILKMLYEGLLRLDMQGSPALAIAEHIHISEDRKTYTFSLRPTYWSSGQPLIAQDFEYSWKKILDPSFTTIFDYLFHPIKNARKIKNGELPPHLLGVKATSHKTLVVELEKPIPYFLDLCCHWMYSPLCRGVDEQYPGWAHFGTKNFLCNGPFKLSKWNPKKGFQLQKNEWYWDKEHVYLERIDGSVVENSLQALRLFEQGLLDWIGEPLSEPPFALIKQKDPRIHSQKIPAVQWFTLNVQKPPFCSPKMRHAFSYALDRKAIIEQCLGGDEQPSHSLLPKSLSLLTETDSLPYNPKYAKQLFSEALEEQKIHPSNLHPLTVLAMDKEPQRIVVSHVVHSWEETFKIPIHVEFVNQTQFLAKISEQTHNITATIWYSWFHDPLFTFEILKNSQFRINASRWSDDCFVQLLDRAEQDVQQRDIFLRLAEKLVMQEMPIIPIFDYTIRYLKNETLSNIFISRLGNIDFRWATS